MRYLNLAIGPRTFSAIFLTFLMLSVSAAFGEGTRTWEQSKFDELVKGTPKGVAIRSSGGLELAPALKALYTSPSTYIWSIAADDAGNMFAAAGAPARIYRITPEGQATVIFAPQELQVQALLVDKSGIVYAATAPDGKVYRVEQRSTGSAKGTAPSKPNAETGSDSSWSATVYFDAGTKYIWDLVEDNAGNLYVATGDHGEIYRVNSKGEHSLFFKSDEVHIRVLALDPKGNLIAGSDGSGLVYRISPNGTGFVLYSAPKKEITALAIDDAGNIYAAGAGEKRPGALPSLPPTTLSPAPSPSPTPQTGSGPTAPPGGTPVLGAFPAPGVGATGGSEVYRIAPDGSPTRIWTSHEDLVYALAFDLHGQLLAGTGNRGHIFAIHGPDDFTDLLRIGATQVTAFAKAPNGGLYLSSSNFGKIFLLGPAPDSEGSYESDVFDAHIFSRWGRAEFRGAETSTIQTVTGARGPRSIWSRMVI
jgi:sugar lactone lactonase YvrE